MSAVGFLHPEWLWALLLVPLLGLLAFRAERQRVRDARRLLAARLAVQLTAGASPLLRWTRTSLFLLAVTAGIVALARPHAGYTLLETTTTGRDIILAMDVSRSMLANDLQPNRLVRAQLLADDIVRQLPGDRIGIVAFAGSAFLQAPLTVDHGAVLESVQALDTTIIPRGGSNIAQAIRLSLDAFGKGESSHRALVLLSDGEELDADAIPVARQAAEAGIRIFTVGIGTPNGSVIPIPDEKGGTQFLKDPAGNLVTSKLDANKLREIANLSGGNYYELASHPAAGTNIARAIRTVDARKSGEEVSREPVERFQWPLGVAVAALLAALILPERARNGNKRGGRLVHAAVVAATMLVTPSLLMAADSATKAYTNNDFDRAYELFAAQAQKSDSPRDAYNAGTAALKANKFDQAIAQLGAALATTDQTLHAHAAYNLASVLAAKAATLQEPASAIPLVQDAIANFRTAEQDRSLNENATFNRQAAERWLQQLEQLQKEKNQQQQNQQQNQQQQDQQSQNQQQPNDGKSDKDTQQQQQEQGKSGQPSDPQQRDSSGPKDQEQQDHAEESQQQEQQNTSDSQKPANSQTTPEPTPVPGQNQQTLEGEIQQKQPQTADDQQDEETGQQEDAAQTADATEAADGEMTKAQARAILESLRGEERRVLLLDSQNQQHEPSYKDW